jgi:KAP family P-loop domain
MTETTTFIDINAHVNRAITDYLEMSPAPRYALCVTGEWGSGKTFLLKQQIAKLESSGRPVAYVSLNGLTNTKQIDDALLDQFFPVLRNKNLKVASRLLNGVIKGVLKVDIEKVFDVDSKALDGSLDLSMPTSKLDEFLSKTNDSILFFDDIERSKLSIEEVLGYINYFVEHTGQKILVGCAESQIPDKFAYLEKKEKVIEISLPIKANAQQALNGFLDELPALAKKLLNDNYQIILKIFKEAGYNNLRVLRQSCLRFDTIIKNLTQQQTENNAFVSDLIGNYFPLALEIYGGKFLDDDLKKLVDLNINYFDEDSFNVYHEKYSTLSYSSIGWTKHSISRIWIDFFILGAINKGHFAAVISAHQSFYNENTPSWKRLWYWKRGHLSQADFEKYLTDVLQKIDKKEYKTISEVMHAWCIVLGIQEKGLWPEQFSKIYLIAAGTNYIEARMLDPEFFSKDLIRGNFDRTDWMFEGLDGLGLHGNSDSQSKSEYLTALMKTFHDGLKRRQLDYKKQSAVEFISLLTTDTYNLNDYLDGLQSLLRNSLFEDLDFNLLIDKFNVSVGQGVVFNNLSHTIKRQLKSGYIDKDNILIKTNFLKLKTVIIEKLAQAKASRNIVVVQLEYLLVQISKVLSVPPATLSSAVE